MIRNGQTMNGSQMLNLIAQLSVPSILAQLTNTLMVYIDASMVGSLGAKASASIGIVQSTTWLFGGLTSAAAMGFSVQAAHFIGANDFVKARQVFRQGIMATALFTLILTAICLVIAGPLPLWLGGGGGHWSCPGCLTEEPISLPTRRAILPYSACRCPYISLEYCRRACLRVRETCACPVPSAC